MSDAQVTLVDYGLGNIQAFAHIYRRLGLAVQIASDPPSLASARRLVLPGVGSFDWAISKLDASGMRDTLDKLVLEKRIPVLGVCVGMQMMATRSEEGVRSGLSWIDAEVVRLESPGHESLRLPHMGWNSVTPTESYTLFRGLDAPRFYFLHSFVLRPKQPEIVLSTSSYGASFASAIGSANIFGTQFHPEKSHQWGITLLRNFAEV